MKHKNVLKRAWALLWGYKALWIFGIILAITSASYSSQSNFRFGGTDRNSERETFDFNSGDDFGAWIEGQMEDAGDEFQRLRAGENLTDQERTIFNVVLAVFCVIIILIPFAKAFYYISETALIKMVDEVEESDKKYRIREGFSLGWSKEAWRLFLVDLVIFLPLFVVTLASLALAAWPLVVGFFGNDPGSPRVIGLITAIGLFFVFVLLAVIVGTVLGLLKHFIRRKVVLEKMGVFESIRQGARFVWENIKDVGLMWLINVGINIAWPIVLIPLVALLFGLGAVGGGLTALLTSLVSSGSIPAISIFGGVVFLVIMSIPLFFVGGLKATYLSTAWTLTYRELATLETLEAPQIAEEASEDE